MSSYLKGRCVVDPVLTSIAHGYGSTTSISGCVSPVVLTDKEGIRVPTFGRTAFVEYDTRRVIGTDSNVLVRERTGTLGLVLGEHDLVVPVGYREQAEPMLNEESKAARRTMNGMNPHCELIIARLAQGEGAYHIGHVERLTISDRWTGGKRGPIGMIETGMEVVYTATGLRPDLMTMGAGVMALLKFHPAIQAAIGVSERKRITTEILQDLFQIEEIVIGAPVSLPSVKAAMDRNSVSADVWGDNLMLHYADGPQLRADSMDESEPSFGYTLRRKGTPVVDKYDGVSGKVKYCRYTDIYKVTVVGGDAGYLITGISK